MQSFITHQHFATISNMLPFSFKYHRGGRIRKISPKRLLLCWNIKSVPEKSLLKHLVGAWEEKISVVYQWLSKSVNDILIREIAKCKSLYSRILNQVGRKEYLGRVLLNRFSSSINLEIWASFLVETVMTQYDFLNYHFFCIDSFLAS